MIEEAPRVAEELSRRQREELLTSAPMKAARGSMCRSRFRTNVIAMAAAARAARFDAQTAPGRPDHFSGCLSLIALAV